MTERTDVVELVYRDTDSGVEFTWHGGAYIDIGYSPGEAFDVINVWDEGAQRSTFELIAEDHYRPFRAILEAFEARCREWLGNEGF